MSEVALTPELLRSAIREKLRAGASGRDISVLINEYVPHGINTERMDGEVYRVPVELIPLDRWMDFLDALNQLPAVATPVSD